MSFIGLAMNVFLAVLLGAALVMGWRLNRRLKALRDSHEGFAVAVRELNMAAARAEQGLADLRAATDEAVDVLGDRIEKGRALAAKLEKITLEAPAAARRQPAENDEQAQERRLGALLASAREARARPERLVRREPIARPKPAFEDDLFEDPLEPTPRGARR
ncbi:DUF6468 domain-containing protein [Phenylobacterium sp. LjRoot225]|uniref:DUF6468 domain-containing protein n=1 Tax=Phenylobacterium sp. LjRoot225 TaxID=3342285 RepID=UPI003ECC3AE5